MKLTIVTGEFPVLSQSFIVNKVLRLAGSGLQVKVMAMGRGKTAYYRAALAAAPDTLRIQYLPPRDRSVLATARLPGMAAAAMRRSPEECRRLVELIRSRRHKARDVAKHLYRLLPFVGEHPDIMHFEFASKAVELIELFDLLPCRKVVSCRGADVSIQPLSDPELADGLREVFNRVDRVHCVSRDILERGCDFGLDPEKAFVNHPSIDSSFFQPPALPRRQDGPLTIVSVGRLHWKKGYEYALQAIRSLVDRGVSAHYQIVGEGAAEDAIRFALWELRLEDRVELLGAQPKERVRELLTSADVFLLPSLSEGLSNAALEAMATELPVVTTTAGGMAEAVRDGIEGYVVPTRSPDLMAERLARLAADPTLRAEMGRRGRDRIEESFTIERQTARFLECYRELLAGAPRQLSPVSPA
jgi:colanic acid/amylovoran biosynthesis glycosyltransferase